jgi:uncharacterized protein (TIGR03437 family)
LNDVAVAVAFGNANQINFFVPQGFASGPAILKLTSASGAAFPVLLQIDPLPPVITGVNTLSNIALGGVSIGAGEVLQVAVTGLDPSVIATPGRLRVTVSGMEMAIQQITPSGAGTYQIQIVVNQSFGASQVPLVVSVDGAASAPVNITVR